MIDMGANIAFVLAERLGDLSTVAVVTNLYPIGTIALARIVLGERFRRLQLVGVAVAVVGTAFIAMYPRPNTGLDHSPASYPATDTRRGGREVEGARLLSE